MLTTCTHPLARLPSDLQAATAEPLAPLVSTCSIDESGIDTVRAEPAGVAAEAPRLLGHCTEREKAETVAAPVHVFPSTVADNAELPLITASEAKLHVGGTFMLPSDDANGAALAFSLAAQAAPVEQAHSAGPAEAPGASSVSFEAAARDDASDLGDARKAIEYYEQSLAAASKPSHSLWAVATKDAAQMFMGGVMRRVPMASVFGFSDASMTCCMTCNVACSDVMWVESVLADVGAERVVDFGQEAAAALPLASHGVAPGSPTSPDQVSCLDLEGSASFRGGINASATVESSRRSGAATIMSTARGSFFIDVVADDDAARPSWISSLRLRLQHAGVDKVALLLELLLSAFPEVSAGQVWVCDGSDDAQLRLLSFASFPDGPRTHAHTLARPPHAARVFVAMLQRELGVDPLAVTEVVVSHDLLAFPKLGGKVVIAQAPTPAVAEPTLAWKGFLDAASIGAVVPVAATGGVRMDAHDKRHGAQRTLGAVVSSLTDDCTVAYAVTAGHFLDGIERLAACEEVAESGGEPSLKLEYVGHCDATTLIPREAASVMMPNTEEFRFAALVDVAVFSFKRDCSVAPAPVVQRGDVNAPVLFPSPECWAHAGGAVAVCGPGRLITNEKMDEAPIDSPSGDRTFDVCGWMTAAAQLSGGKKVTQCLYLSRQTSLLGFVPGHSGGPLYAIMPHPQLHSFVTRNVSLTEVVAAGCVAPEWSLHGSTPALLALEQARGLIKAHQRKKASAAVAVGTTGAAQDFPADSSLTYVQPVQSAHVNHHGTGTGTGAGPGAGTGTGNVGRCNVS